MAASDLVVNARILYWGISGAGKTANLEHIYGKLRPDHRGQLERIASPEDPGVSYELMPIELGKISGVKTRLQIIAPPGAPEQAATRQQLLDQVDGIVFVIDSRRDRVDANLASFEELKSLLQRYGRDLKDVPVVLQYNHRDQADDVAVEEMHRKIDLRAAAFEAIAPRGIGVLESLTTISKRVVRNRREASGLTLPPGGTSLPPQPGVAPLAAPNPEDSILEMPPVDAESTIPEEAEAILSGRSAPSEEATQRGGDTTGEFTLPESTTIPAAEVVPEEEKSMPPEAAPPDSMAQAIDLAARRAERVFDDHWDQATGGLEERTRAPESLDLQIVAAGNPVVEEGRRLRIALRLVDQDGRQGDCILTLDLSTLRSD